MSLVNLSRHKGFSLIEMAIVMVIVGVLIGAALLPLSAQRESTNIKKARSELSLIEEAIYGFAIAQGRLPCPAEPGSNGLEVTTVDGTGLDCDSVRGFVPAATLGIKGDVNCDGLLLDPWNNPYRLSITNVETGANGMDFISNAKMRAITMANLAPNIRVCREQACATELINNAVAVYFSMGKNWPTSAGSDQDENAGEATINNSAGCPAQAYGISSDNDYVHHDRVETGNNQFDDIVMWMSANILYAKMLAAAQLP